MSLNDVYNLPATEKLHLIEKLWDTLDDNDVKSPDWHGEILTERKKLYDEGKMKSISLEDFKRLRYEQLHTTA